jgi:uncharacterized protein YdeI (YjbR/CyaY-like superfamily)
MPQDDLPRIHFETQTDWERWLDENHAISQGLWLKIAKKASGVATVTYPEAIEVALCFGWIDGQRQSFDDVWYLQRFTPRRPRSRWSQINREKVELLTKGGRMRPSGLREVQRAKDDGRWDAAYPSPSKIEVPDDLRLAIDSVPSAAETFASLNATNRYALLLRLHHTPEASVRANRIEQIVTMLAHGETDHT